MNPNPTSGPSLSFRVGFVVTVLVPERVHFVPVSKSGSNLTDEGLVVPRTQKIEGGRKPGSKGGVLGSTDEVGAIGLRLVVLPPYPSSTHVEVGISV